MAQAHTYGGILLPPTCKINYVNIQHNYVNMRLIYVDMQHNYDIIYLTCRGQKYATIHTIPKYDQISFLLIYFVIAHSKLWNRDRAT